MNQDGRVVAFSIGLLVLRVVVGVILFAYGAQKLFGWFGGPGIYGFSEIADTYGLGFGIPVIVAWVVGIIQFAGGILIFFGLFTRICCFATGIVALVSLAGVHWGGGFFAPEGVELSLLKFAAIVALFLTGAGLYSLDVGFAMKPKKAAQPAPAHPGAEAQGRE